MSHLYILIYQFIKDENSKDSVFMRMLDSNGEKIEEKFSTPIPNLDRMRDEDRVVMS